MQKVIVAKPRGFCAGVERAINTVEECLAIFGKPVYVKHAIVHNTHVVKRLEKQGAITVETVEEIPEGSVAVFSAHGSPPSDKAKAKERNIQLIDATCPLVTKVHLEVHRYTKQGYQVIYIGHKGHVEAKGVRGELPGEIPIVETEEDVAALSLQPEKCVYLTQTTLSVDDTKKVIAALQEKYPHIEAPPSEDICYATTNRQAAVRDLAKHSDLILIVGSQTSSNSKRLVETAKHCGVPAYLVEDMNRIQEAWLENVTTVGISSGASAPDDVVQEIITYFKKQGASVEERETVKEEMFFKEPIELIKIKNER